MLGKRSFVEYRLENDDCCGLELNTFGIGKRQRIVTVEQSEQLDLVTDRVLRWFQTNQSQLPKTKEKLMNVLTSLCKVVVRVDEQIIFYHLLLNDVIRIDGDDINGTFFVNDQYDISQPLQGFVLSDSSLNYFSEDFCFALQKSARWMKTNRNLPKSKQALMTSLKQICQFSREVPVKAVLDLLFRYEFIATKGENNELQYFLPKSCFSNSSHNSHYAAVESNMMVTNLSFKRFCLLVV